MIKQTRFGRKIPVLPTTVIKHELRMMAATDSLTEALRADGRSPKDLGVIIGTLMNEHHISLDQAHMLMDRLQVDRTLLKLP